MPALVLSRHLSFHARGDAAFVWHGLTGDVAEMSRDVVALLLAFSEAKDPREVAQTEPGGIPKDLAEQYTDILRGRRFLLPAPPRGFPDETSALLSGFPRVPRGAVFFRKPGATENDPPAITVYGRDGQKLELDAVTAKLFDRCNGERTLGQVLADAGPDAIAPLLRLARADFAALKILAKRVSEGGVRLNPAADSTMPYPEVKDVAAFAAGAPGPGHSPSDLAAYHKDVIDDPDAQFDETETTLAHLFRAPHPALRNRTFGAALAAALLQKGALKNAEGRTARVLEVGGGLGYVGQALREALAASTEHGAKGIESVNVDLSPALATAQKKQGLPVTRGDALHLPVKGDTFDLIVCNEMAGDLGTTLDPESLKPQPAAQPAQKDERESMIEAAIASAGKSDAEAAKAGHVDDGHAFADEGSFADEGAEGAEGPAAGTPAARVTGEAAAHVAQVQAQKAAAQAPQEPQGPRFINTGALELVRQCAKALKPGGVLYISEFGDPKANPIQSDHLDHDEWSIRFDDLKAEAEKQGLKARVQSVPDLLMLDGNDLALSTTRSSYAGLRALFKDHGLALTKRAWLRKELDELCAGKLDLTQVFGLQWTPLLERTMGLSPRQFFALIATKPAVAVH